jgi:hypothetical protein
MRRVAVASSLLSLTAISLLAGCPDRSIDEVTPLQGRVEAKDIPVTVNRDVDLLFVIDDSPSMADKQGNLIRNFGEFIKVLATIQGGLPNIHIGVVTSDMGTRGADGNTAAGIGTLGQGGCSGLGKNGGMQLFGAPVVNGPFISDIAPPVGPRQQNYPVDRTASPEVQLQQLADVFGTMARAGAGGCGFEQHLEAMKKALDPSPAGNPTNDGFLRPDAFLAVVFIVDEDDCSMRDTSMLGNETPALGPQQSFRCTRFGVTCDQGGETPDAMNVAGPKDKCHPNENSPYLTKVSEYVTFLKGLKDDPGKVIVAGIMGTNEPFATELRKPPRSDVAIPALAHSCTYTGSEGKPEVADPPIRLKFFLDQFPNRSTFASICQPDLTSALQQIGDLLKTVIGNPCIEGKLADVDPSTPEPDFDCSVSSVTNPTAANRTETILARCPANGGAATDPPCWHLVQEQPVNGVYAQCPLSEHYLLKIERQDTLPPETHIVANCVTQVDAETQN